MAEIVKSDGSFVQYHKQVQKCIGEITRNFIKLGIALKTIRDLSKRQPEILQAHGYTSFSDYLAKNKLHKGEAFRLIQIIEIFMPELPEQPANPNIALIERLGYFKCKKILPYLTKHPDKREDIIQIALNTPSTKLDEALAPYKKQEPAQPKQASITIYGTDEEINTIRTCLEKLIALGDYGHTPAEVLATILHAYIEVNAPDMLNNHLAERKQFTHKFCELHKQHLGMKYKFEGGKDAKLVQRLLQQYSLDELCDLLDLFFNPPSGVRKWWTRYTIGTFSSAIPDLIAMRDRVSKYDKYAKAEYTFENWRDEDE